MKRAIVERNLVVVLFILVLVIFSFAERDSRKLHQMYAGSKVFKKEAVYTAQTPVLEPAVRPSSN